MELSKRAGPGTTSAFLPRGWKSTDDTTRLARPEPTRCGIPPGLRSPPRLCTAGLRETPSMAHAGIRRLRLVCRGASRRPRGPRPCAARDPRREEARLGAAGPCRARGSGRGDKMAGGLRGSGLLPRKAPEARASRQGHTQAGSARGRAEAGGLQPGFPLASRRGRKETAVPAPGEPSLRRQRPAQRRCGPSAPPGHLRGPR